MSRTSSHRERELKFEAPSGFVVPELQPRGNELRVERGTVALRSTYYDSPDLDLLAQRITLRRRTGDTDTGWQLKIPAGVARQELAVPLGEPDEPVPSELRDLLAGVVRGEQLVPVATLSTQRHLTRLRRGDDLVVEIADDHVSAAVGEARALRWRELEIELGPAGDEADLARYATLLRRAGARPSRSGSKLARALGRDADDITRTPAGRTLAAALGESHRILVAADIALRRGPDEAASLDAAVLLAALDRLHALVRVFRPVLAVEAVPSARSDTTARALQAELAWYRRHVRAVRDAAVVATLLSEPESQPDQQPPADREGAEARAALVAAVRTNRYRRLLAVLAALAGGDPARPGVSRRDLRALADHAERTALRRIRRARRDDDPRRVRRAVKAARRARYAVEATGRRPRRRLLRFEIDADRARDARLVTARPAADSPSG